MVRMVLWMRLNCITINGLIYQIARNLNTSSKHEKIQMAKS